MINIWTPALKLGCRQSEATSATSTEMTANNFIFNPIVHNVHSTLHTFMYTQVYYSIKLLSHKILALLVSNLKIKNVKLTKYIT